MVNLHELRAGLDKGKSIETQMDIQMKSFLMKVGALAGLNDTEFYKKKFDEMLENKDFSSCQAIVFEFDDPPPVMVSGAVNPDFDFNGKRIQDLGDLEAVPNLLAMNSFYDGQKGYVVMSWLEHSSEAPKMLMQSFLEKPSADHEKYLVQYMFKNFENCFIAPYWWDKTAESDKKSLIDLMEDTVNLRSEPNSNGIASVQLNIDFPRIQLIKFINWEPEVKF